MTPRAEARGRTQISALHLAPALGLTVLLTAAGCLSDGVTGGDPAVDALLPADLSPALFDSHPRDLGNCTPMALSSDPAVPWKQTKGRNMDSGARFWPAMELGDPMTPDQLLVDFFDRPQSTGTFDLGALPDNNYDTCTHCIFFLVDLDNDTFNANRIFTAVRGTMVVERADTLKNGSSKGHATDVEIREIQFSPMGTSLLPGGACFELPPLAWDTPPCTPSATCR